MNSLIKHSRYLFLIMNVAHMYIYFLDSCLVNNGGCDPYATCSQDEETNSVKCTCKPGFTNTGTECHVKCEGIVCIVYLVFTNHKHYLDSCKIDNGGCPEFSTCFHDDQTNAVKCNCNTGYTNVGTDCHVQCQGKIHF